jgi:hypothetical protein
MRRGQNVAAPVKSPSPSPAKDSKSPKPKKASKHKGLSREERQAQVDERLKELEQKVENMGPKDYAEFLEKIGKNQMWRYSANNLMMINIQNPDATRVASYKAFQAQGRQVKKGETGMVILRPLTSWRPVLDDNGKPVLDDKGKPKKRKTIIRGQFGLGRVFDISQTKLKDGAEPEKTESSHSADSCAADMSRIAEARGVRVFRGGVDDPDFPHRNLLNAQLLQSPNAGGYFLRAQIKHHGQEPEQLKAIVTRKGLTEEEEARVLAHELGHACLHDNAEDLDPHLAEVEAESVAYAVCADYGIETDHSAAYIVNWAKSRKEPTKELKASMERVRRAVRDIFEKRED